MQIFNAAPLSSNKQTTNKLINIEMKEHCQLCGTRVRLLEIKHHQTTL